MNIIDHEFLMPGHIFVREDGSSSRLLFVTNTSLSPKVQKQFPPQIVYADENDNVLSRDVAGFLATREFVNVDPELEAKLNALLIPSSSFPEDELNLDVDTDTSLVITGADELDDVLAGMSGGELSGEAEESEEPDDEVQVIGASVADMADVEADMAEDEGAAPTVTYVAVNEGLPVNLTAEQLSAATAIYQQLPNRANGNTQHILFIRGDDGITEQLLDASFNPLYQDACTLYAPQIVVGGRTVTMDWDILVGIFPSVSYGSYMFQVILEAQPQAEAAPAVAEILEIVEEAASEGPADVAEAPAVAPAPVLAAVAVQAAPAPVTVAQPQVQAVQVSAQVVAQ